MSRSLVVGRMLAGRPSPAPLRRYLWSLPKTIAEEIASLSEEERSLMSNHLAELDAELESRLADSYSRISTEPNDRGILDRVLTFCGLPAGEQRDRLFWRSLLAATLVGSVVAGHWEGKKCVQYHDKYLQRQEEKAAAAAANHAEEKEVAAAAVANHAA